jgi:hypothetical protein
MEMDELRHMGLRTSFTAIAGTMALVLAYTAKAQAVPISTLPLGTPLTGLQMCAGPLRFAVDLRAAVTHQFMAYQNGVDVLLYLAAPNGQRLAEIDSPNGAKGAELLSCTPDRNGQYHLVVERLPGDTGTTGTITVYARAMTPAEITTQRKARAASSVDDANIVQYADIDHFWATVDALGGCRHLLDSLMVVQRMFIDVATEGQAAFMRDRELLAEDYLEALRRYPRYFASIRATTADARACEPIIQEVFDAFRSIYAGFTPFKVCFGIGVANTGGTTSRTHVWIGTELTTTGENTDFSERGPGYADYRPKRERIPRTVRTLVAHECVHTQQPEHMDSGAVPCLQLQLCLEEGAANFISELLTGGTNYRMVDEYGLAHEEALWTEFLGTLCAPDAERWLYNGATAKDRPADLGYFIGYRIVKAYYDRTPDKTQAIAAIIGMRDPLRFLVESGYGSPGGR